MSDSGVDVKDFTCPVCLEIYEEPRSIPCGHILCKSCLKQYEKTPNPACPVCRENFHPRARRHVPDVERDMARLDATCSICSTVVKMTQFRAHMAICGSTMTIPKFKPIAPTTQHIPSDLPNRSTFKCPYCSEPNLDTNSLREHCNKQHKHESKHIVCPICASMPWGNENQQSGNFLQHLNLRHKFEYDTYVDYGQDDDIMLQQAIQASLGS